MVLEQVSAFRCRFLDFSFLISIFFQADSGALNFLRTSAGDIYDASGRVLRSFVVPPHEEELCVYIHTEPNRMQTGSEAAGTGSGGCGCG